MIIQRKFRSRDGQVKTQIETKNILIKIIDTTRILMKLIVI